MTQEDLIQFLKDNLKIKTCVEHTWETTELGISLYLGDESISSSYETINN